MDFIERIAEKVIPTLLLMVIVALFNLYMDVEFLKAKAIDYKGRADKIHDTMIVDLRECTRNDIVQNKDIEYLKGKQ